MNEVLWLLSLINDAVFVSLVNTTLQITLIIPLIAIFIFLFRLKSTAIRYSLWLFATFSIIILPVITPLIPQIDPARFYNPGVIRTIPDNPIGSGANNIGIDSLPANGEFASSENTPKVAINKDDIPLVNPVSIAYFLWCAGALFMFGMTFCMYRKVKRLKVSSPNVEDLTMLEMLSVLRHRSGIRRRVFLKVSPEIYTPISLGVFTPAIILPDTITGDDLEMVLIHELAHIRRFDYLIRLIQNILRAIFFFHPLFHLMNRNLIKAREHICDDWVINATNKRGEYARCIVGLLEKSIHKPLNIPVAIAMAERKQDVPERIEMITDRKRKIYPKVSARALTAIFLIGCLFLLAIGGVEFIHFAIARPASNEGLIVFQRGGWENPRIWVMDTDGKNEKQLTESFGKYPVWSPDGKQVAFAGWGGDIYIMNADGSDKKQLTEGFHADWYTTWSPDGKQIAFSRRTADEKLTNICVMNADGSDLRVLIEEPWPSVNFGTPSWSPDGKKIAFCRALQNTEGGIWVIDADGKDAKMLTDRGFCPRWSPDGSRIVFSSALGGEAWNWAMGIFVMDADGKNRKRLTPGPDPVSERDPDWSPDGTNIVFCSDEGKQQFMYNIYIMDADGSNVQRLTDTPLREEAPDWTASSYAVEPGSKLRSTWGRIKGLN